MCGCGTDVRGKWARGHYARVNNPSKNPVVREKQAESARRRIESGERSFAGWNKGLSKEMDPRVAAYGQKGSKTILSNPEHVLKRSALLKEQWQEGRIHAPSGPAHGQWKGGVSIIQQRARAGLHHYWGRPIMERDGFQCQSCHAVRGGDLVVHHDIERFAAIMHWIVAGRDVSAMSFDEQGAIVDEIVRHHIESNVHGITLCRSCHDRVHEIDPDID
jgi:5-methylcytosine-specific restriction endonuclease McrA